MASDLWTYFAYLGSVKDQNGAAMSLGRTSTFLDIYIQRDLDNGTLTEEQAQEYIDHFIMKLRIYNPGLQSKLLGFINLAKNENLVFIAPDNNGNNFLLGDALRGAILDSIDGMTTGQKTEERPGAGMIFSYKTANICQYTGTIPSAVVTEPGA